MPMRAIWIHLLQDFCDLVEKRSVATPARATLVAWLRR
jgi:hypothetical protein